MSESAGCSIHVLSSCRYSPLVSRISSCVISLHLSPTPCTITPLLSYSPVNHSLTIHNSSTLNCSGPQLVICSCCVESRSSSPLYKCVAVFCVGKFRCAGTIIDRRWVMVSGDCAYKSTPEDIVLYAGSTNASLGTHYAIESIVTHPKYDRKTFDHDFALLKIKGEFKWSKKIKKIALPKKEIKVGTGVVVAGWGNTASQTKPLLQEGFMGVISLSDCANRYKGFSINFTDTMGCIYKHDLDKNTTLCLGDWSDPITRNNVIYLIFLGIGEQTMCTSQALPAVCGDVLSVVPWIKEVIKKEYDAAITNERSVQ